MDQPPPATPAQTARGPSFTLGCLVGAAVGSLVAGACGFFAGIAATREGMAIISGVTERSAAADTANPIVIERAAFRLRYPGNWSVDTKDPDYDPDRYFDLNAPAQGKVLFHILPARADAAAIVDNMIESYTSRLMTGAQRMPLTAWGGHQGQGVELRGKILIAPGRLRAFTFSNEVTAVVVTEIRYDEDEQFNRAGYDLIESSFELLPAPR